MKKFLVVISGPTAAGKTSLSISLATHFHTEILSADARQFYLEMNIGTAKPSVEQLTAVPHHFINHLSIHQDYSAGKFEHEALMMLNALFIYHDVLIMTGGSGLFIRAVLEGFDSFPPVDDEVREKLLLTYHEKGIESLREMLKGLDPHYYEKVDLNNHHRLIRALSVCLSSGKPFSSFRKSKPKPREFEAIKIGIETGRNELYKKIDARADQMISDGLLEEAKELFPHRNLIPLQTVGYSELFDFLEGKISFEKATELIKKNTRNYAKRQLTWLRGEKDMHWFQPGQLTEIIYFIEQKMRDAAPHQNV